VRIAARASVGWRRLVRRAFVALSGLLLAGAALALSGDGADWAKLTPAQQQALAPLERTWPTIDAMRRQKWLELARRFERMSPAARSRVQQRMSAWAAMTPAERASARLQYQETRQLGAEERQALWQAYQSLPEDERRALALKARNAQNAQKPDKAQKTASDRTRKPARAAVPAGDAPTSVSKNNVVAAPRTPRPRPVTSTVVQATPGATTTTISTRAAPPRHHQPGLPKIVATPGFVDPATLLPRRGPQGAAALAAEPSGPAQQP